jgi:hypothetical protein
MDSFELDIIDEKSRAGSEFMFRVAQVLQRAFLAEKKSRKITQQSIAEKLDTSRAVINRQLHGLENIGARRIGELLWAMGWEPSFEAKKIPAGDNYFHSSGAINTKLQAAPVATTNFSEVTKVLVKRAPQGIKINSDITTAQ